MALGAGLVLAAAAVIGALRLPRRIGPDVIARQLDRALPATEESAELLLRSPADLTLLERLERARVDRALASQPFPRLPDRQAAVFAAGGAVALLSGFVLLRPPAPPTRPSPIEAVAPVASMPPEIAGVTVEIRPPGYTGRPARRQQEWELDVVEGSVVRWTVQFRGMPAAARIMTSMGDTLALTRGASGAASARLTARRSTLYEVVFDSTPAREIHRLIVRADQPPAVTVLRPAPRTRIEHGAPLRVAVEVLARDDHGIADVEIVATVTSGEGESVRFREQRIPLVPARQTGDGPERDGTVFRAMLDLAALDLRPGDELYFHALARDRRRPEPNEGRSGTVFISLADTAAAGSGLIAGISLPAAPEYFRSQRQIIIDTERLIADAKSLPVDIFRERANGIGMDQGLLRLRYGQFTGEEFEEEVSPDEVHDDDDPENATLLSPSVRTRLKAAIAEMWEAELRLRTYRPAEALPFEYRALELIKSIQQESRVYVQRAGFEPPPLEPDRKRLTGETRAVRSRSITDSAPDDPPRADTRRALEALGELALGAGASQAHRAAFAAAESELAALAAQGEPAALDGLRRMRVLIAALRSGAACADCVAATEAALVAALPPAAARPAPRGRSGSLARRYAEILAAEP